MPNSWKIMFKLLVTISGLIEDQRKGVTVMQEEGGGAMK